MNYFSKHTDKPPSPGGTYPSYVKDNFVGGVTTGSPSSSYKTTTHQFQRGETRRFTPGSRESENQTLGLYDHQTSKQPLKRTSIYPGFDDLSTKRADPTIRYPPSAIGVTSTPITTNDNRRKPKGSETIPSQASRPTEDRTSGKQWLQLRFADKNETKITKPHELEKDISQPPQPTEKREFDRIAGSMLAMAIGDALGAHVEFRPRAYLEAHLVTDFQAGGTWGLEKGQFTDDTSMALCLANSLIACQGFNLYDQLVRYKWWYRHGYMSSTGECFDIGNATRDAIEEFERRQPSLERKYRIPSDSPPDPQQIRKMDVHCSGDGVAGNGALMRLAPVPLFFFRDPPTAVEYSGQSGQITHGDRKVYDACRYYGALIVAAMHGYDKDKLLDDKFYDKHRSWFGKEKLHPDILDISRGSYKKKKGYNDGIRGGGYILKALEAALWAFWSTESFREGALAAVNLGDDTDTTAAIYGQLAGAFYGLHDLDKGWGDAVYARKFLMLTSAWLGYEGEQCFRKMRQAGTLLSMCTDAPESLDVDNDDHRPTPDYPGPKVPPPPTPDIVDGERLEEVKNWSTEETCRWLKSRGVTNDQTLAALRKFQIKGFDLLRLERLEDFQRIGLTKPRDYNPIQNAIEQLKKQASAQPNDQRDEAIYLPPKSVFESTNRERGISQLQPHRNDRDQAIYSRIRQWIGNLPGEIQVDRIELLHDSDRTRKFVAQIRMAEDKKTGSVFRLSALTRLGQTDQKRASERLQMLSKQVDHSHPVPVVRGWYGCRRQDLDNVLNKGRPVAYGFTFASSALYAAQSIEPPECLVMSHLVLSDLVPALLDGSGHCFRFISNASRVSSSVIATVATSRRVSSASAASRRLPKEDLKEGLCDEFVIFDPETILDYAVIHLEPAVTSPSTASTRRPKP